MRYTLGTPVGALCEMRLCTDMGLRQQRDEKEVQCIRVDMGSVLNEKIGSLFLWSPKEIARPHANEDNAADL